MTDIDWLNDPAREAPQNALPAYVGRFAPSPTGPMHSGSLVAAMASYLDAQAHHGKWCVRIEDVDQVRAVSGAAEMIQGALATCGMRIDGEIVWQSKRSNLYAAAFARVSDRVYPCGCSRREIADSQAGIAAGGETPGRPETTSGAGDVALAYPGTCRHGMAPGRAARAWRLRVPGQGEPDEWVGFVDRICGPQRQHLGHTTGDFVLRRADGFWAYQLAVVVDDGAQHITHVVRGMDLLDSTPRQIYLQHLLGLPTPVYMHTPLLRTQSGEKLSKQTGAAPLDLTCVEATLVAAARVLGLHMIPPASPYEFWQRAIPMWATRYPTPGAYAASIS